MQVQFNVELNGTDKNPFHALGLTQNPFPQIPVHAWQKQVLAIQKLGGDPIPKNDPDGYIRETLAGCSEELIELCCQRFKSGEMTKFRVTFDY